MKLFRNISLLAILIISANVGISQDELISPNLVFQYFKNTDNQRSLKVSLSYIKKRLDVPLKGCEIGFYGDQAKKVSIGNLVTDDNGVANLILSADLKLPVDKDNAWYFFAEFNGNDSIEAASAELTIKDVNLEMELTLVDSVKTVILKANTLEKGKSIPVSGESVLLYVPRMFSLLPVGDGSLDENGEATVDFPTDIPGDKEGNITVIARFEEHPSFGNVEKRATINWGVAVKPVSHLEHRALWTKGAPTWMIIALSIMLVGVWGHYAYAVFCLIRIKLSAKKDVSDKEFLQKK